MSYLPIDVEVFRQGITIIFSQALWFIIENQDIQIQEEGVGEKNLKTPRRRRWKHRFLWTNPKKWKKNIKMLAKKKI